jgi:hypothetical protein
MPFKPLSETSAGSKFLGIKPISIVEVTADQSKGYEVFLKVKVLIEGSDYENDFAIIGNFDRAPDGRITNCSVLKKINKLFETVEDDGGVDIHGKWVDGNDSPIQDIGAYLTSKYGGGTAKYPYIGYVYKKEVGNKKYTEIYPYIEKNNENGIKSLNGYIDFIKSKGILKEAEDESVIVEGTTTTDFNGQF